MVRLIFFSLLCFVFTLKRTHYFLIFIFCCYWRKRRLSLETPSIYIRFDTSGCCYRVPKNKRALYHKTGLIIKYRRRLDLKYKYNCNVTEFGSCAQFVLHLHGDTMCVKVKWVLPAGGLGPEPKIIMNQICMVISAF